MMQNFLKRLLPWPPPPIVAAPGAEAAGAASSRIERLPGFGHPAREMLLDPILPERSLAMLYAPRGLGKSWLSLSIGLAVAGGSPLLRWSAPKPRKVLFVDGEMPLVALQERLRALASEFGDAIGNDGFQLLAADSVESGIDVGSFEGQRALEPLLDGVDLADPGQSFNALHDRQRKCRGRLDSNAKLAAETSPEGRRRFACPSCRNQRPPTWHFAAGGCLGHGDRASATR